MAAAKRAVAGLRGLPWVIAALGAALAPHLPHLPAWATLLVVAAGAWRWAADRRRWPLPPTWLRVVAMASLTVAVLGTYRTVNGIEAGTVFLALMAGVKLLETRAERDLTVLIFIAYFLLYAALLRDQRLAHLPYLLVVTAFTTAALMRVHAGSAGDSGRDLLRRSSALLLQALPLALLLFLLFPRLPGPFWGIAAGETGRTGLGDEMTPGDISDLSVSGEVAFRVRFDDEIPPPIQRYWRGPVLHDFDGRSWRRPRAQTFPAQEVEYIGDPVDYQITLEPTDRPWILALDMPAEWPAREAFRSYNFQLVAPRRLTEVASYRLRSYPRFVAGVDLPDSLRRKDTQLPPEGNPRSRALARELALRHGGDPLAISRDLLVMFREQPFIYTLDPPRLADNAMDEFLFETRRGFCEHYASAYTLVMRAAGVPARVVTGYQGGEFNPIGGYLIVRQSDAHAWSEIWVAGRGWLRVDPTAAVAPERVEQGLIRAVGGEEPVPGRLRDASAMWLQVELTWDTLNDFWNERVVRFNAARQMNLLEELGFDPDWRTLGLGLAGSLAAFFVSLSVYLAWRYREPPRDWPARLHAVVVRRLRRRGLTPTASEGPVAFLERAEQSCPDLAWDLAAIRRLYVDLRYGPLPTDSDLRHLKHRVNRLRP